MSAAGESPLTAPDKAADFQDELKQGSDAHAALDRIPPGTMGGAYFEMWLAELAPLCGAESKENPALSKEIERLKSLYRQRNLTWTDLNALVRRSLPCLAIERIDAIRCYSRTYYYQRARPAYVADYDRSSPPALNALSTAARDGQSRRADDILEQAICADAVRLHDEITRIEIYRPYQEEKRTEFTRKLNWWTVGTVFALLLIAILVHAAPGRLWTPFFPVIPLVMAFGALGAAVSSLRRLQDSFDSDASILNITKYLRVPIGIKMVPIVGAIFALIMLLLLTADIVPQDLLPDLQSTGGTEQAPAPGRGVEGLDDWVALKSGPASAVEYAKLLVFSFLAGFAERLVPDTLDRLTGKKDA